MLQRVSSVGGILVRSVLFSSTVLLGDSVNLFGYSRALAVQREREIFFGDEGNFNHRVFFQPLYLADIYEPVNTFTFNQKPVIKVGTIDIKGISSASVLQVGSTAHIKMESRIKHIRQLEDQGQQ